MIDGLEDWFTRQEAKRKGDATSVNQREVQQNSGLARPPDVDSASIGASIGATDADDDDGTYAPVGDFAGMPAVKLPESRHDGLE
jgi:hypothetical protein